MRLQRRQFSVPVNLPGRFQDTSPADITSPEDLAEFKADVIKWMIGLMLASAGLASTIALLIQRFASQ